jgi:hypothetical protein
MYASHAATPSTCNVDFSGLESFHLLLKSVWNAEFAFRLKLNIVDTILFKDGRPNYWIFTSDQTGVRVHASNSLHSNQADLLCYCSDTIGSA